MTQPTSQSLQRRGHEDPLAGSSRGGCKGGWGIGLGRGDDDSLSQTG